METRVIEKKRIERGKRLHGTCYMTLVNLEKTFFIDKKIFKLQASNNKQNDIIYKVNLIDIRGKGHSEKNKFPKK